MARGQKHLVGCRCILPQFRHLPDPPRHHFVVFSVLDDDDTVKVKFAQCNNCGTVHKVTNLCTSEILVGRESASSIISIDDIKLTFPPTLANILELNDADLPTWEATQFIYENKKWGDVVTLSKDVIDGTVQGKYLMIIGENLFKVDTFTHDDTLR